MASSSDTPGIKLKAMLIAQYAVVTQPGLLDVGGVFENFDVRRKPGTDSFDTRLVLPPFFLVAITTCSLSLGTEHRALLRVVNDDGHKVSDDLDLGTWKYIINKHGRPMVHSAVIQIQGIPLPRPGDYVFELHVDGQRVGETSLYVTDMTGH